VSEALKKIAEGREAELFLLPDGRVLRLVRPGMPRAEERIRLEAAALAAAVEAGAPAPRVFETVVRDGRPGLIMERLEEPDLLTLLGRRPWLVLNIARRTAELHAELHRVDAPAALPRLKEWIRAHLEESDVVPEDLHREALSLLDELPDGDRLCHGDFHPGNIMVGGERPAVVDWTSATRGDPAGDVARTWVLLEASPVPPGAPALLRRLVGIGRGVLLHGYARAYLRRSMIDADRLSRWTQLRAIERLAQDVPGERERLLTLLGR